MEAIAADLDMDVTLLLVNSSLAALQRASLKPLTRELAAQRAGQVSLPPLRRRAYPFLPGPRCQRCPHTLVS